MGFIASIVGSSAKMRLLGFLLAHRGHSYSVSELAQLAGMPKSGVSKVVGGWEGSGLIRVSRIGNVKAVGIDERFFLLPELERLFTEPGKKAMREATGAAKALRRELGGGVAAVVVYGSVARGDLGLLSDIDLLVITPDKPGKRAVETAAARLGPDVSVVAMTEEEAKQRVGEKDGLIANMLNEGKAVVGGEYIERLKRAL